MDAVGAAFSLKRFLTGVRVVIPMHFGTFPALAGRPEQLKASLASGEHARSDINVHEMQIGDEVSLSELVTN